MFTHKRNFDCVMCGTTALVRKIIGGHIIKCGCGEIFTATLNDNLVSELKTPIPTDFVQWKFEWVDNSPCDAMAWVPVGFHPSNTEMWGLINYADMMGEGHVVTYTGEDVFGRPVVIE